jgi:hypothetical protein
MKIRAVGIALFHTCARMNERADMTRLIAFTTAPLQKCLIKAYARQRRCITHYACKPQSYMQFSFRTLSVSEYLKNYNGK